MNITEEKVGNTFDHTGTGDHFLNIMPAAQTLGVTINKWDLLKSFCKERTWSTRQNESLQIRKRSSLTPHQTEVSDLLNIQRTQEIGHQKIT